MRAVRFELTHLSIAELKSAALDHSAKLADIKIKSHYLSIYSTFGPAFYLLEEVQACPRASASTVAWLAANKVSVIVIRVLLQSYELENVLLADRILSWKWSSPQSTLSLALFPSHCISSSRQLQRP